MTTHEERLDQFLRSLNYAQQSLDRLPMGNPSVEEKKSRHRFAKTLDIAPELLRNERNKLKMLDDKFVSNDEHMDSSVTKQLDILNEKVINDLNKIASSTEPRQVLSKEKFDMWNYYLAETVRIISEHLLQLYQRQHQPIPVSRMAQQDLEEKVIKYADGTRYVGHLDDGKRHGHGSCTYPNDNRYDGEWKEDKCHGLGVLTTPEGTYEGDWENGQRRGFGVYKSKDNEIYCGQWNGEREGWGKCEYANGDVYEGEWENGKKNGYGKLRSKDGTVYEGEFRHDLADGRGTRVRSHTTYVGNWKEGKCDGFGTYESRDEETKEIKERYEGDWKQGQRHGLHGKHTKWTKDRKRVIYKGEWKNDIREGKGTLSEANGDKFEGLWEHDSKHGSGVYITTSGKKIYQEWKHGKLVGEKEPNNHNFFQRLFGRNPKSPRGK